MLKFNSKSRLNTNWVVLCDSKDHKVHTNTHLSTVTVFWTLAKYRASRKWRQKTLVPTASLPYTKHAIVSRLATLLMFDYWIIHSFYMCWTVGIVYLHVSSLNGLFLVICMILIRHFELTQLSRCKQAECVLWFPLTFVLRIYYKYTIL